MTMRDRILRIRQLVREGLAGRGRRRERGMTLVEVMVVVVIISLVAGVVGVAVLNRLEKAREKVAFTQIKQIGEALELYKLSLRRYPSTAEGLQALTQPKGNEKPFMNSIPTDPWGNEYVYIYPGTNNTSSFDIMSYGGDGVQGGGDDISNWDNPEAAKQE
jgi:general secretion pathway protein G